MLICKIVTGDNLLGWLVTKSPGGVLSGIEDIFL